MESTAASIFNIWEHLFKINYLSKFELSEEVEKGIRRAHKIDDIVFKRFIDWQDKPNYNDEICVNKFSKGKQNPCAYNFIITLLETYDYLLENYGTLEARWGYVHRDAYKHTFSGTPLKPLFHLEHESDGNRRTVKYGLNHPQLDSLRGGYGPGMRIVMDADPQGKNEWIVTPGASESIFSKHYGDQMELFYENKYLEMNVGQRKNFEHRLEIQMRR